MRIRRRKNGYWYGIGPDGKPFALRTKDRDTALRRVADASRQPKGHTVAELMTAYFTDKADLPSAERMKFAWKQLAPHFGHLRPDQITNDVCKLYAAKRRRRGVGDGTIRKELTTLRAGLRFHNKNTPANFLLPPSPPSKDRYLTLAEYRALMEAAKMPHIKLFIAVALTTAGRKEAVLDLEWDRVHFDTGRINLGRGNRQKGRAVVTMGPELRKMLEEAFQARTTDYVIEWAGDRVKNIRKAFDAACERAGLEGVTPHVLRHTAAVWMAEAGRPMQEIAQFLGHSDSRTTERIYARFSPDYLAKSASILDSALSGN